MAINPYFFRGVTQTILKEIYDFRKHLKRPEEIEGIFSVTIPSIGYENKNVDDNKEEVEVNQDASSSDVHIPCSIERAPVGDGNGPHNPASPDHLEDSKEQ